MEFIFTITVTVLVAITIGIVEVAKQFGVDKRWCPIIALLSGVLLTVGLSLFETTFTTVVTGLTIGLSASGLYDIGKRTILGK